MPPKRRSAAARTSNRGRKSAPIQPTTPDEEEVVQEDEEILEDESIQPVDEAEVHQDEDEEADIDEDIDPEDVDTPAQGSPDEEDGDAPALSRSRSLRRHGRAGKPIRGTRPEDWGTPELAVDEIVSGVGGTPRRGRGRGRGRGGFGASRGARPARPNRGPSHVTQVPIDKEGNMLDVVDDEVDLPEDADGETKVDKNGALQNGREYRVRTFKLAGRGDRLYMLSTEPARCTGFRDSYLFFAKHPTLYKIIIDDYEKKDLIDRELIPHSYKGRAIGVVTARSVFREFGCKIIVGGKKITDDYNVAEAKARGDKEGDLADPTDVIPAPGRTYNRNQYVAWHGASAVYHSSAAPTMPQGGKPNIMGKRKANLTAENWLLEHSLAASRFNSGLTLARQTTMQGVYDTHTNLMMYPASMQPTHARWEVVPPKLESKMRKLDRINGAVPASTDDDSVMTNGYHEPENKTGDSVDSTSKVFKPLSEVLTRNFLIVDTVFETPAYGNFSTPGVPAYSNDGFNFRASGGAPTLTEEQMEIFGLPEECRQALREANKAEREWTDAWESEGRDGLRDDHVKIGLGH